MGTCLNQNKNWSGVHIVWGDADPKQWALAAVVPVAPPHATVSPTPTQFVFLQRPPLCPSFSVSSFTPTFTTRLRGPTNMWDTYCVFPFLKNHKSLGRLFLQRAQDAATDTTAAKARFRSPQMMRISVQFSSIQASSRPKRSTKQNPPSNATSLRNLSTKKPAA